jgi:hypothetical protein
MEWLRYLQRIEEPLGGFLMAPFGFLISFPTPKG